MKRKNCMKRKYMFMALLCYALTTAAQDASHNYVRTRSMLDETGGKYWIRWSILMVWDARSRRY